MHYVYMLRCDGNTLYTGYTPDLLRRCRLHRQGKGAKYTRSHRPQSVAMAWSCQTETDAMRLEYAIKKKLKRPEKERLLSRPTQVGAFFPQLCQAVFTPLPEEELRCLWEEASHD